MQDSVLYNQFGDKRYLTWNWHLKSRFGEKIFKVPIDAGFDCPNRDGTAAYGGCTFCSARGSGDFAGDRRDDIRDQFHHIKDRIHRKWKQGKYMAYFQAYTNTHAPVETLKQRFEPILSEPGVIGIAIGTRPDCLPDEVVDYLADLHERTYLWVELGLQTAHDQTGRRINRAHDFAAYKQGVAKLRNRGIRVCCHIINGLPGETEAMMKQTAKEAAKLDIQGMKIHLLHVLSNTPMAKEYENGSLTLMDKESYIQTVCDQLELLPPDIIIHRVTGDGPQEQLIGPLWSRKKWEVLNGIDDELKRRDSFQGEFYTKG
ncbi:TIGR01212 family radical SAM protein [Salisediminibacterium halotolerans]|uniref:TIGR01212 family radical SAM protein n=1 Tax=Salisediminibacterium halotolerans TaxID=517425 RepID=UPI000EB16C4F|nr:TIGR01212 family radical SAM protein [Salisediminibacterium halotolerans]RLJ69427.1 hypothetical protein BCL39_2700 [Actinophytocola xinjiangensis]RPE83947.1 hypothetical protein EDD67_2508 [Salisediminibacterium halotolerans]TWG32502.1 hypothetical protein BCL52_2695 [Salisediminibacterium halotolerans]GEL07657.1 TIGR01212 family radical SAM protein [Salisediminibacterium halotolerans]